MTSNYTLRMAEIAESDADRRLADEAEDALDRAAIKAAREEDDFIPWEEVKAQLG